MASINILTQNYKDAKIISLNEDDFLNIFSDEEKFNIVSSISLLLKDVDNTIGYWCLITDVFPDYVPKEFNGFENLALAIPAMYNSFWKFGACYLFSEDEIDSDSAIDFCKSLFQIKLDIVKNLN